MDTIQQAIFYTEQNLKQFLYNFSFVPDDKLNWSPSPTARTPMQILSHTAVIAQSLVSMLNGIGSDASLETVLASLKKAESELTDREQAIMVLKDGVSKALEAMKALKPEQLSTIVNHPFMNAPIATWMNLYWRHLDMHTAQIEYLQSCWGDNEFHFAG
jgi:hypothetical protein